jgi:hypothetical protein
LLREVGETPQGRLCPEILVAEGASASDDGYTVVQEVVDFTNWATEQAALTLGEIPPEAVCAYHVDYYLAQVDNGGHDQWASNGGLTPLVVRATDLGLEAMKAEPYRQIFREYLEHVSDPHVRARAMENGGFGEIHAVADDLDRRFYALGSENLVRISGAWLRCLPILRELDPETLQRRRAEIAAANPLRETRLDAGRRGRREMEDRSPLYRSVKAACAAANLTYQGLTAGGFNPLRLISPALPDERPFSWGVLTNAGVVYVFYRMKKGLFGATRVAEVYAPGRAKPLASVRLTPADYQQIVPPA